MFWSFHGFINFAAPSVAAGDVDYFEPFSAKKQQ